MRITPTWQELDYGLFHVGMKELTAGIGTMAATAEIKFGLEAWLREYSSPSYVGGGVTPLLCCALIAAYACLHGNKAMC